ncbi:fluoroquinolone resistance protein [Chania multitudinisentens RB-25]|uniref:Fluoroquinolone resistance protein n=1 Tax=Chania multitudinisentens RB-25 TaxID=1441930 RepID=W0LCL6_9GAMM|nr:Qnr family pentapeptide repeat protein [Chania multitudinisentens]AHG19710.2 fluoroquinolone resistance protein [Chania multitudinisentens RB-25]
MQPIILQATRIERDRFRGETITNGKFLNCDFSGADLTDTQFIGCLFYDETTQLGCSFNRAVLKDASFKSCDLSLADFRNTNALGLEIRECKVQGADFRGANFMNMISQHTYFCSAFITKSNLSYANFSKVVLEKCELWENRWNDANVLGATFIGSDLSGGEFNHFDWRAATFNHCNLTGSQLGELDIRQVDLEGVQLDSQQIVGLIDRLGIVLVNDQ